MTGGFQANGELPQGDIDPRHSDSVPSPYQKLIDSPAAHRIYLVELYPHIQEAQA